MQHARLLELLAKKLSGEISVEEKEELNSLVSEDYYQHLLAHNAEQLWQLKTGPSVGLPQAYQDERWTSFQRRKAGKGGAVSRLRRIRPVRLAIAASVAAMMTVTAVWLFSTPHRAPAVRLNIVSTKNGSRSKIYMPDGSQVWLNAGSRLTYDNNAFGRSLREVSLDGEAFFDVEKDREHPFVIHTRDMDVKVLGTSFNVKSYPNDSRSEATLVRGMIEVSFKDRPNEKIILKPNEKISVANLRAVAAPLAGGHPASPNNPLISVTEVEAEQHDSTIVETAWVKNQLVFHSQPFDEVARQLERWYNVSIRFQTADLEERKLTGTFRNETVTEALNYLQLTVHGGFRYEYDKANALITIYR